MPVDKSSRYAKTSTVIVTGPDGSQAEMLDIRDIPRPTWVLKITPDETDRLDLLADRYYRDSLKFWRICDASEQMDPFDVLSPGQPLPIPPDK